MQENRLRLSWIVKVNFTIRLLALFSFGICKQWQENSPKYETLGTEKW